MINSCLIPERLDSQWECSSPTGICSTASVSHGRGHNLWVWGISSPSLAPNSGMWEAESTGEWSSCHHALFIWAASRSAAHSWVGLPTSIIGNQDNVPGVAPYRWFWFMANWHLNQPPYSPTYLCPVFRKGLPRGLVWGSRSGRRQAAALGLISPFGRSKPLTKHTPTQTHTAGRCGQAPTHSWQKHR